MGNRRGDGAEQRTRSGPGPLPLLLLLALTGFLPGAKTPDPVGKLREASTYWEKGKSRKALARLSDLRKGDLADHVELLRARWLRETGELAPALEAAQAALDLSPPSEVRARSQHEIAQIRLAQGDLLAAYRAQRAAWESTRNPDYAALLVDELAHAFDAKALPGDALKLYNRVWQKWPLAETSAAAFERSRLLTEATGAPAPAPEKLLRRANRLRRAGRCEEALATLDLLLAREDLSDETWRDTSRGRANCMFRLRRYNEAVKGYRKLVKSDPKDYDAAIFLARSLARDGNRTQGIKQLETLAKSAPRRTRARAQYLLALLMADTNSARAEQLLRKVEGQRASKNLSKLARWALAWDELRQEKYKAAIKRLKPLKRGSQWDVEVQRARYWSAVARVKIDPERGREELTDLAESLPLSYYGLLAADRLETRPEIERSFVGERAKTGNEPSARRTSWLLEAGLDEAARDELESWVRTKGLDRANRVSASRLLHEVGEHPRGVRIVVDGFGGALEQGIDPEWRDAWHHAWPRPFETPVGQATQEFGSDPALVYAVMREESTYLPSAESPAGALGLMQIIPPTADRIAQSLGVASFKREHLFNPETNIRFGAYYLKDLLARFDGSSPLAIAAYNAGPEAVTEWRTRDGVLAHDAFVESVPYGETRRYLRRVLRSYRMYHVLYGEKAGPATATPPQSQ